MLSLFITLLLLISKVNCYFKPNRFKGPMDNSNNLIFKAKSNKWQPPTESTSSTSPPPLAEEDNPNGLAYEVELPKSGAGIDWGADLSFRWVYVLNLDPQVMKKIIINIFQLK